jgi:hypothetical protein
MSTITVFIFYRILLLWFNKEAHHVARMEGMRYPYKIVVRKSERQKLRE